MTASGSGSSPNGASTQLGAESSGSLLAAWVIGPYLVLQLLALAHVSTLAAYAPDGAGLARSLPFLPDALLAILAQMPDTDFRTFRRNVVATGAAGLGGAVFMVREFYINFAYGGSSKAPCDRCRCCGRYRRRRARRGDQKTYLRAKEIPRYVLLPFSATILGPIGLALLQVGAIAFSGLSAEREIPVFTTLAVCFGLGFSYHDTLKGLRDWSQQFWSSPSKSRSDG